MAKNKNAGKPRNYALECGVYRFGRSKMYHKKAIYKFNKKKAAVKVRLLNPFLTTTHVLAVIKLGSVFLLTWKSWVYSW